MSSLKSHTKQHRTQPSETKHCRRRQTGEKRRTVWSLLGVPSQSEGPDWCFYQQSRWAADWFKQTLIRHLTFCITPRWNIQVHLNTTYIFMKDEFTHCQIKSCAVSAGFYVQPVQTDWTSMGAKCFWHSFQLKVFIIPEPRLWLRHKTHNCREEMFVVGGGLSWSTDAQTPL